MIDDTKQLLGGTQASQTILSSEVDQILKYRVVRDHAVKWSRNLRFLTFDDSDVQSQKVAFDGSEEIEEDIEEIPSGDAGISGQCKRCELRTPVPSGHQCEAHVQFQFGTESYEKHNKTREQALREYSNPCVHVCELTCQSCQHIPLFPNEGAVSTFKIRRVDPNAWHCRHFVAVSYCWAAQPLETNNSSSLPYKVIEEDGSVRDMRASKTTIDRVVDFARENGFRMIWIDQECIEQDKPSEKELAIQAMDLVYLEAHTSIGLMQSHLQQKHLDALLLIYEASHSRSFRKLRGRPALRGCRTLNLNNLTEAISIIVNDKWNTRAWVLQEAFVSSGNMTMLFPRSKDNRVTGWTLICHERSLSEIAIRLDSLVQCIRSCFKPVSDILRQQISRADNLRIKESPSSKREGISEVSSVDLKMTLERLRLFHPEEPREKQIYSLNGSRIKRVCNAAVALTYLRLRELYSVPDKLAIVANMCGYSVRLDTTRLGETQDSLGACMIALSLCNHDFSLITPEVYRIPKGGSLVLDSPSTEKEKYTDFSWNRATQKNLPHLYFESWNSYGNHAFSEAGYIPSLSSSGLSLIGILWTVDRFISLQKLQRKYSDSWASLNRHLAKTPASTVKRATTHLLFEILEALIAKGEMQAADSIVNSTLDHRWRPSNNTSVHQGIESVKEFPTEMRIENRQNMFSLEESGDGRFHQCWIIDRVMEKGGFWVGRIANPAVSSTPPESMIDADEFTTEGKHSYETKRGHQTELFTGMMLSGLMTHLNTQDKQNKSHDQEERITDFLIGQGDILASIVSVTASFRSRSLGVQDMAARRSIFDIDGDESGACVIFQPYHQMLESIPRPALRSMSVSWIVKRTADGPVLEADGAPRDTFSAHGKVKGMWRYISNMPLARRVLLV